MLAQSMLEATHRRLVRRHVSPEHIREYLRYAVSLLKKEGNLGRAMQRWPYASPDGRMEIKFLAG